MLRESLSFSLAENLGMVNDVFILQCSSLSWISVVLDIVWRTISPLPPFELNCREWKFG